MDEHNHVTRDVKPRGECPACDVIHDHIENPKSNTVTRAAEAVEYIIGIQKDGPWPRELQQTTAKLFNTGYSSIARMLGIYTRSPAIFQKVKNGEIKLAEASREAGYIEYRLDRDVPAEAFFGKGDKFWEASGAIHRYLTGWESRGYAFTNVSPKEAERRIAKIEKILSMLEKAREDLIVRSDRARLTVTR